MEKHPCEECSWRKSAEANPKKISSRLWYWHTKICPGWKAYQKHLKSINNTVPEK